jgi:hypothetical protein
MAETVSKAKMIAKKRQASTKKGKVAEVTKATTASRKQVKKIVKADIPLKTNTTAKPRKTPARKDNVVEIGKLAVVSREMIEQLAYRFWAQRGFQHGEALQDWLRAEQELLERAS